MNDEEIEGLLRSVRPAGPPPELRARIVAAQPRAAWRWLAVAAALFAIATALQVSAGAARRSTNSTIAAAQPVDVADVELLRERFGSDQAALDAATLRRVFDALGPKEQQDVQPQ